MRSGSGIWGLMAVVCASTVFGMGMGAKPPSLNLAAFSEEVEQELPTGSPVGDVVTFLDAHKLAHSGLISPQQAIYSIVQVKKSSEPGAVSARVELQFWFTPDGRFMHFRIRDYDPGLN